MGSSWGSPHPPAGLGGAGLTAGGDVLGGFARAQGQRFLVVILRRGSGGQRRSRIRRNLEQKHLQHGAGSSRSPSRAQEGSHPGHCHLPTQTWLGDSRALTGLAG